MLGAARALSAPSLPPSLPAGAYLKHTGEFTVQYVLENRLLGGDGKISKSRKVKVMDVDECTYDGPHAEVSRYRGGRQVLEGVVVGVEVVVLVAGGRCRW